MNKYFKNLMKYYLVEVIIEQPSEMEIIKDSSYYEYFIEAENENAAQKIVEKIHMKNGREKYDFINIREIKKNSLIFMQP